MAFIERGRELGRRRGDIVVHAEDIFNTKRLAQGTQTLGSLRRETTVEMREGSISHLMRERRLNVLKASMSAFGVGISMAITGIRCYSAAISGYPLFFVGLATVTVLLGLGVAVIAMAPDLSALQRTRSALRREREALAEMMRGRLHDLNSPRDHASGI